MFPAPYRNLNTENVTSRGSPQFFYVCVCIFIYQTIINYLKNISYNRPSLYPSFEKRTTPSSPLLPSVVSSDTSPGRHHSHIRSTATVFSYLANLLIQWEPIISLTYRSLGSTILTIIRRDQFATFISWRNLFQNDDKITFIWTGLLLFLVKIIFLFVLCHFSSAKSCSKIEYRMFNFIS